MADKHKVEAAVGGTALAAGAGVRPVAFGHYHRKRGKLTAQRDAAQSYLTQGGKPKRDPSKKGLDTNKKKAALRTVNETNAKLKGLKAPVHLNRSKVWVPLTVGGAAMTWHGGRKSFEKRMTRDQFDATAAGVAGGAVAHQGVGLGLTLHRMKVMDQHSGEDRKKVRAYNKKAIPKGGMQTGDPKWKGYWRSYPKDVPGGKLARTLSRTHGGKTGAAVLAGSAAAGGLAGKKLSDKKVKKDMTGHDAFAKAGNWKTIEQREQTQRSQRKKMRVAGAAVGAGGGLMYLASQDTDKGKYGRVARATKTGYKAQRTGIVGSGSIPKSVQTAAKVGRNEIRAVKFGATSKVGAGLVAGGAVLGGANKAGHTYQQHKINQRRRQNLQKSSLSAFGVDHG